MRLCYVGWADHVHLERWAGHFAARGHQVSVLSRSGPGRYPPGVRQFRIGLETRGARWRQLRLRWLVARLAPEVVHVHWAHFAFDAMKATRLPLVVTAWGSDVYQLDRFPAGTLERLQASLRAAAAITCDSHDLARTLGGIAPESRERIHVVQWGVDTEHFRPAGRGGRLARELGVGERPVVFSPRNFTPLYNQETIVRAFRLVLDARPDALLVFKDYHGDAAYRARVLALARELGVYESVRVVEALPYESMPELYSLADVSVSVPDTDATPMSLLEAMACGSVPVCSDLPSVREWITDATNGWLVPARDCDMLARRVVAALDPAIAGPIASVNRALVEARASQHRHMARMLEIYERVRGPAAAREDARAPRARRA